MLFSNKKRRVVFLFGAGAIIDWGGPKTLCSGNVLLKNANGDICCLTHLINSIGFYARSKKRISQVIFDTLVEAKYQPSDISFETIINVIEELIVYYSQADYRFHTKSLLFPFLEQRSLLDNILNYKEDDTTNGKMICIPDFQGYESVKVEGKTPEQLFFELLLIELLGGITGHVSKYSYHTANTSKVIHESNANINNTFYEWIKSYLQRRNIVRMYSLNYDDAFKTILNSENVDVFDGFVKEKRDVFYPDLYKIISDTKSTTYYNLHGSVNWRIELANLNKLPSYRFYKRQLSTPYVMDKTYTVFQMEKGKPILLTNIVTGYQKAQKAHFTPFKQMQATFDRDCIFADEIIIVGYSFGDEHINESIKTSIRYNSKVRIRIVDSGFFTNDLDQKMQLFFFSEKKVSTNHNNVVYPGYMNLFQYTDFNTIIHAATFKDFLNSTEKGAFFVKK